MSYYAQGGERSIFGEHDLDDYLQDKVQQLQSQVESESEEYLVNVNEAEYIKHLVDKYAVNNLDLFPDRLEVKPYEKEIAIRQFPTGFNARGKSSYKRTVLKYYLPFEGDIILLECRPMPCLLWTTKITSEDNNVCFEIVDFSGNADEIKHQVQNNIDSFMQQLRNLRRQVDCFNSSLELRAQEIIEVRKQNILRKYDLVARLGVPIRSRTDVPSTFAVPAPKVKKKIVVEKPMVNKTNSQLDPSLNENIYEDIIKIIHDVGRQFERMPSTYAGKVEEDLRDYFLLFLEPNFEGSATGETFNKSGKTDILLRYEHTNVFVAECKFWTGSKGFLNTIDQLLGYLTWRDSKAAIVFFVENKNFTAVIEQVEDTAGQHFNYLGFNGRKDETVFNFRFHLNGDPDRQVKVAVLLFHLPK